MNWFLDKIWPIKSKHKIHTNPFESVIKRQKSCRDGALNDFVDVYPAFATEVYAVCTHAKLSP